jgi:pyrimidine operon attenuation protein / uracil phosphoribosyltransferase
MPQERTIILTKEQIEHKLDRIAWQIYEDHQHDGEIIVAGIEQRGYRLAEMLVNRLEKISKLKCNLVSVALDKDEPLSHPIQSRGLEANASDEKVVVVDDVLNSGKTLMYALQVFLTRSPKKLSVAVLVDRDHKRFPVKANYVGMSLSTTYQEHVVVDTESTMTAYLE